ncbi:hypothetical protein WJX72_010442 [[Myrmecia] bisecta]|uniref:Uncharacterized protein n=1 Tax=[Myrmecia] bisecta TaxID=41462 RepID=A0AAW1R9W1_9CHLO
MCTQDQRLAGDENPWVGVGPDRSRALCFNLADSKMLPAGMIESNGAVRALHWEHCPVSAAADLVVLELHLPGKLRADSLATHHILRAPKSPGTGPMAASTLIGNMGTLLREAGVPCNLTVKAGGKHTVTHHCKQYALALAGLVGVDYANMQWIASHERDVTRMHYLTLATDAMHRMGGFGPQWASAHLLGRAGQAGRRSR